MSGRTGRKISRADVGLFTFVTASFGNREGAAASIDERPKIKSSVALIKNLAAMREHLTKRAAKAP